MRYKKGDIVTVIGLCSWSFKKYVLNKKAIIDEVYRGNMVSINFFEEDYPYVNEQIKHHILHDSWCFPICLIEPYISIKKTKKIGRQS